MPPGAANPTPKLLCLAGFMGCGKTTVGRLLARQLGWRFVDLDTLIEERAGLSIAAIFEQRGEAAFREMESAALERTIGEVTERDQSCVVALGGGTFVQPQNLALLRAVGCPVVWLYCSPERLLARCALMPNRPLFRDEASFRQLYEQRLPFYEQADYRVESESPPARVVEQILALGILERVNV